MPNGKQLEGQHSDAQLQLEELVKRASEGDKDALCELCEKIAKSVLFQVTYILGRRDGVEDVAQEVLIRMCENIRNLRSPKAFKVWLVRIIINEKNRYLAKSMKLGDALNIDDHLEDLNEESVSFIPQDYVEDKELRQSVMQLIMDLPARQRETVIMHYYDGLSVTEISKILGVATQSVSKNLAIAREKLKQRLGEHIWQEEQQMGALAALPIGTALGEMLQRESAIFAEGEACVQDFVARCTMNETAQMAEALSASSGQIGTLAVVCATVLAVAVAVRVRHRSS